MSEEVGDAPAQFDAPAYAALHRGSGIGLGLPLHYSEETGSTNDDALRAAKDGAPHGSTFVTELQTQGRGRRGRKWLGERRTSLMASVLIRTALPTEAVSVVALAAGLSVRAALERALASIPTAPEGNLEPADHPKFDSQTTPTRHAGRARDAGGAGSRVTIKWPNDVWLDRKKVAGILCESQVVDGRVAAVIVGFGINVGRLSFPDELAERATSLHQAGVAGYSRETVLIDVLSALEVRYQRLSERGTSSISEELLRYDALFGLPVSVDGTQGTAEGIDSDGRLKVRTAQGTLLSLSVGTVELL